MAQKKRVYKPRPKRISNEYRSLMELPEMMTVYDVADVLRVSVASAYTITDLPDFPLLLLNCQRRVRADKFTEWLLSKEHKPNGKGKEKK